MVYEPNDVIEVRERRVSPVLWVLLAVVLIAALFFFVILPLFQGEEEEFVPPAALPTPVASPTVEPSPTAPPEETFEVFESKDPFRPLVTAGAPPAAPGTTPAPGGATPAPGATAGAAGGAAPTGGTRVQLVDIIDGNQAQVRVGSTVHTVSPGEEFAGNFKLVSIQGNCATLLHGDDRFTLCEGEEVFK